MVQRPTNELALDHYENLGELGHGAYGYVFKGQNRETGEIFAIKKTNIVSQNDGIPSTTIREIAILVELEHENIVRLKDIVMTENDIYFI